MVAVIVGILILASLVTAVTVITGQITEEDILGADFGVIRGKVLSQITDDNETVVFKWQNGLYSVFAVPEGEEIPLEELNKIVCNQEGDSIVERVGEYSIRDDEDTRLFFSEIWRYNSIEFYRVISEPSNYICPWECYTKYGQLYEGEVGDYMVLAKSGEYELLAIDTRDTSICDSPDGG